MTWRQSLWMGAGIVLLLLAGYLIQSPFRDITTPPVEQTRESAGLEPSLSYVSIPITLPLTAIRDYANREIPEVLVNKKEHKKFNVRFLGIPTTIKGEVETVVVRRGAVQVSTQDDWLVLSIPLWFKAEMDGKRALDPDAKTRGEVTITARFQLDIDESWQPQLKAEAGYVWDKKPYLRMGPVKVRISSLIGEELEEKLDEAIRKLQDKVSHDMDLKKRAATRWYEMHQVRTLSSDLGAWLLVDPDAIYFPPIQYSPDSITIEFGMAAYLQTSVGNVPPPPVPEPLPELVNEEAPQKGFSIQLPVRFNYKGISERLNAELAGRTIALDQGELTAKEFRLYASENALVVAARISATSSGRLFNTHGWIYLTGEPRYDAEKHILYVDNLDFSRRVDNMLVSGATWVLQDRLRDLISKGLQYDLHDRIEALQLSANELLNRSLGEGFTLSGQLESLNLAYLVPQQQDLLLVLSGHGQLAIESTVGDFLTNNE